MSVQRIVIEAAEHDIFSVLLDPYTYPEWLVGAQRIRSVDDAWPEPGTAFHHVVGFGPINSPIPPASTVCRRRSAWSCNAPRPTLRPGGRAFHPANGLGQTVSGSAGEASRTEVSIEETPASPVLRLATPVVDPGIAVRNDASLKRLRDFVLAKFPPT